jgi:hypothetical protein
MIAAESARPSLSLLWRGPLDSCNYGCAYCPFAKRAISSSMLARDRAALTRFVDWVKRTQTHCLRILFTPYGEALIWPAYREALVELSHLSHITQVSIQTNASGPLSFLSDCDLRKVSLWISWHPTEIELSPFVEKIHALHAQGVQLSVGAVAIPIHLSQVEALRKRLPPHVPMWINAQKPGVSYSEAEQARWRAIDPDFDLELIRHRSQGKSCQAGEHVLSIDGDGAITRCHFIDQKLGNLYQDDLATILRPRACTRKTCECWIGYSHLVDLQLSQHFDPDRFLARIRSTPSIPQRREGASFSDGGNHQS